MMGRMPQWLQAAQGFRRQRISETVGPSKNFATIDAAIPSERFLKPFWSNGFGQSHQTRVMSEPGNREVQR
jgi:hypothetical protein